MIYVRLVVSALLLVFDIYANSQNQLINLFVKNSITLQNCTHFGISKISDLDKMKFGEPIPIYEVNSKNKNNIDFLNSGLVFIPVRINSKYRFLVLSDNSTGEPLALGYHMLALNIETLLMHYPSAQIEMFNTFGTGPYFARLVDINLPDNLTQISDAWHKSPKPLLTDYNSTIVWLRKKMCQN